MPKKLILIGIFGFALLASTALKAQEWSAKQKEVWKNVETYWELAAGGKVEEFLSYFHNDFSGWGNSAHVPGDKATRAKFIRFYIPRTKTLIYDIKPLAIKIHGNVAIVHYSYTEASKYAEEKEKSERAVGPTSL